jgi:hypothetical protein
VREEVGDLEASDPSGGGLETNGGAVRHADDRGVQRLGRVVLCAPSDDEAALGGRGWGPPSVEAICVLVRRRLDGDFVELHVVQEAECRQGAD